MAKITKKIGILGGSFDPVHKGHLHLAKEIYSSLGLDEVWFVPAHISPHKLDAPPIETKHRLKMLSLAIKTDPHFQIKDIECRRQGPSYTVETLQAFKEKYPDTSFYLLIGDDTVRGFYLWKDPEEIIRLCRVVVGARDKSQRVLNLSDDCVSQALVKGWTEIPMVDISSTEVRRRLHDGEDCSDLLPVPVYEYILTHGLYASPKHLLKNNGEN